MAALIVWTARQFVLSVRARSSEPAHAHSTLTLRAYREIAAMLKKELDGVYMTASEGRTHFGSLSLKIDGLTAEFHEYLAGEGRAQFRR